MIAVTRTRGQAHAKPLPCRALTFSELARWTVLLLIVLMWLPGATMVGGSDGASSFLVGAVLASIAWLWFPALARALPREERVVLFVTLFLAGFIILLSVISTMYAESPLRAFRVVFAHVFAFAVLPSVAAISLRSDGDTALDSMASFFIASCVVMAVLVLLGFGYIHHGDRAAGYFKHPNQLGIALSTSLPLIIATAIASKSKRLLCIGGAISVLIALAMSGSKTNLVLAIVCSLLLVALYTTYEAVRQRVSLWTFAAVLTAPGVIYLGSLMLQTLNPRAFTLLTTFVSGGEIESMASRERLWSTSIELGLRHPFGGIGAGQPIMVSHSHNVFIDYFRTLGVPGATAVVILIVLVVAYSARAVFSTIVIRGERDRSFHTDVMVLGTSMSVLNYVLANQLSDSFGPSTISFFWFALAWLLLYRARQKRAVRFSMPTGVPPSLRRPSRRSRRPQCM